MLRQIIGVVLLIFLPGKVYTQNDKGADTVLIRQHLTFLTEQISFRNAAHVEALDSCANYIAHHLRYYADSIYEQVYTVNGQSYRNVVAAFGHPGTDTSTLIVGAHYDVCEDTPGADDNASGVTGLLELARLLALNRPSYPVLLVAYTLEEPPFFRTTQMGSYIHASSLKQSGIKVKGMICLEMIGYFKEERHSQQYPIRALRALYGNRADYITVVRKTPDLSFSRKYSRLLKQFMPLKTKRFVGPVSIPGLDFSDHLNYWHFGFPAIMITDTAFYRNPHYHENTDTLHTLDLNRMAKVITGVWKAIQSGK